MIDPASSGFLDIVSEPDENEAVARILYVSLGGFVQWELLPEDGRSKQDYRQKARALLDMLAIYREHHGRVDAPLQPTPEMLEAGYQAMLAARPTASSGGIAEIGAGEGASWP